MHIQAFWGSMTADSLFPVLQASCAGCSSPLQAMTLGWWVQELVWILRSCWVSILLLTSASALCLTQAPPGKGAPRLPGESSTQACEGDLNMPHPK